MKNRFWKSVSLLGPFKLTFALALASTVVLTACSYTQSYEGEKASYGAWLDEHVKEERLFVRGEQRLATKFLAVSPELIRLQKQVAPGFEFPLDSKKHQFIVAVSSQNRRPFSDDALKFSLDGQLSEDVKELTSQFTIQTLYPYADPYYRVFYVGFDKSLDNVAKVFRLKTSRGALSLPLAKPAQAKN